MNSKTHGASPHDSVAGLYSDAALSFSIELLEEISDLVAAVNADLQVVALNAPFRQALLQVSGQVPELGETLESLLAAFTSPMTARTLCQRVSDGKPFTVTEQCALNGNAARRCTIAFRPINNASGQPSWTGIVVRVDSAKAETGSYLEQMIAGLPGMVWTTRADGYTDFLSPQWLDYTGTRFETQLGSGWSQALHPDDRQPAYQAWLDAIATGDSLRSEYRLRRRDGAYHWFAARATPIRDETGAIVRWFGICIDIDDLKCAQEALQDSQQRYATLFSNRTNAIAHFRLLTDEYGCPVNLRIEQVNPVFEHTIGLPRSEVEGRLVSDVFPDVRNTREDIVAAFANIALEGGEASFEVERASGQWLAVYVYSPQVGECISIIGDITTQKHAEASLRASEARYRTLFDAMNEAFALCEIMLDEHGVAVDFRHLAVNPAFERIGNYTPGSVSGRTARELVEVVEPYWIQMFAEAALENRSVEREDYVKAMDKWFDARAFGLGNGRFAYLFNDVTERKRAELALEKERSQLQAILDHAPVLITIKDLQARMVLANKAVYASVAVPPPAQFIGQSIFDLLPQEIAAERWKSDLAVLESDGPVRVEQPVEHKDGSWHTYLAIKFPLRYPGERKPYAICSISTDITEHKQAEAERESLMRRLGAAAAGADQNRAQLEAIFQSIGDGVAVFDMQGKLVMYNAAQAQISKFGDTQEVQTEDGNSGREPHDGIGFSVSRHEFTEHDGRPVAVADWPVSRVMRGESLVENELCGRKKDSGQVRHFSFSGAPVRDENGKQVLAVVVTRDITGRKRLEQARVESERRLQLAVSIAHLGFWEWDIASDECYFSPQWKKQIGYRDEEIANRAKEWRSRLHPEDRESVLRDLGAFIEYPTSEYHFEFRLRHRDGTYRHMVANGIPASGPSGGLKLIGTQLDVTDARLAEHRVLEAARHDSLTGLPNRALIFEYAGHMLAAAHRNHGNGAVLFIDLDRFKPVNDMYGHEIGDRLLQEVAHRLLTCVRKEDMVGRLGGDEFVVVLPHSGFEAPAAIVAQHIAEALARPFYIDTLELTVSASIGISHFPQHGIDVDTLIHAADLAMYQTKKRGRGNYQIYSADLNNRAEESVAIEATLKRALKMGGLALHYQPVVDMTSGEITGAEALLRLGSEDGTTIGPDRFISVAESAGMIAELGEWVATEACRQHAAWCAQGLPPVPIAINVSPLQFRQRGFAHRLESIVNHAGIDPACIQLEVTESAVMDNIDEAIQTLNHIRDMGVRIALDDFGTGYSSLSQLSNLPLDKLKVDQSFVRRLEHDPASRAITGAIIALGRTLNLEVVGEGIESEDAMTYLRNHGCDQAQGYLISRPLAPPAFARWLETNRWHTPGGRPAFVS